ncbi:MAG TPA: ferritin-like domain-containing protein [Chroococcales cyanobacterium]|jgi:bacterioferritin
MEKSEIIRRLNDNLLREHGAIIQYLQHAFILGEGGLRNKIEEIAREEMYHFQWLSEAVAGLKAEPTSERSPVFLEAPTPAELMGLNVRIEEEAIAFYLEDIRTIDRPEIVALLERILRDEEEHREEFRVLQSSLTGVLAAGENSASEVGALDEAFKQEYAALLQTLRQSFLAPGCGMQRRMGDIAIENMKHMGWLGEEIAEKGGTPSPDLPGISHFIDREGMLSANLRQLSERKVALQKARSSSSDPGTLHLLGRIEDNERYQEYAFEHGPEVSEVSELPEFPKKTKPSWTVGNLKD